MRLIDPWVISVSLADADAPSRLSRSIDEFVAGQPMGRPPLGLHRSEGGRVDVIGQHGTTIRGRALLSDGVGVIVGLSLPPLLVAPFLPTGVPAVLRRLTRDHADGRLGIGLGRLEPGSAAIVVLSDGYVRPDPRAELGLADWIIAERVDVGDLHELRTALAEARGQEGAWWR